MSAPADTLRRLAHAWRTKGWLKPYRSASKLAIGRGAQGLLQLAAAAIAAQALGATGFGMLVLINGSRQLIGGITKLRSKHVIMRYGARALESGDRERFRHVLGFSIWIDILSAVVAGVAILALMGQAVVWMNMPPALVGTARLFGLCAMVVALSTSAEALLQLLDRFALVSIQQVIAPAVHIVGGAVALSFGEGLTAFVAVWFVGIVLSRLWLIGCALYVLHRRGDLSGFRLRWAYAAAPEPGLWRFLVGANAGEAITQVRTHAIVLIVAALLNPAAAGLLRVAQQLGRLPGRPTGKILGPAIFPELARQTAAAKHRKRRKTMGRSGLIAGGLGLTMFAVLVVFGETLLVRVFGPEFASAYTVMLLFGAGGFVQMLSFAMGPLLISAGRVGIVVAARAAGTVLQIGAMVAMIPHIGIAGAALAEVLGLVVTNAVLLYWVRRELRSPSDVPAPRSA
jgi:O-antigen/teichoic acid export membrane protein